MCNKWIQSLYLHAKKADVMFNNDMHLFFISTRVQTERRERVRVYGQANQLISDWTPGHKGQQLILGNWHFNLEITWIIGRA